MLTETPAYQPSKFEAVEGRPFTADGNIIRNRCRIRLAVEGRPFTADGNYHITKEGNISIDRDLNCVRIGYHPSQSVRLFVQPLRPSGYGCPGSRLWAWETTTFPLNSLRKITLRYRTIIE